MRTAASPAGSVWPIRTRDHGTGGAKPGSIAVCSFFIRRTRPSGSPSGSSGPWGRLTEVGSDILFFRLSTPELGLLLFAVVLGATLLGIFLGHRVRHLSDDLKEPFGVLQAALLGVVGLLLAFGLSLAVGRYEDRRANIVSEANAIGTTYLRAQTLDEPMRTGSLGLLRDYTRSAIEISDEVPGERRGAGGPRAGEADRTRVVEARGPGTGSGAHRQRAPPLRRVAEWHDRW